jgi:hypothetical protein
MIFMIKTTDFTALENIDLSKEISLVAPTDTPFYSLLLSKNLTDNTSSKITTWREKTLDNTDDISVIEGSNIDNIVASQRAEKNNVCQIFMKGVSISGTAQASGITGVPSLFASEINDRLTEMKVSIEKQLINGQKNDGSSAPYIRKMDGIMSFALDAQTVKGKVLDETCFKKTVKKLWDAGLPSANYYCLLNADLKETIDALYDQKYHYVAQESLFGLVARTIQTNYGNVTLILNRHMPTDKLVIFAPEYFRVSYLRKPFYEMLGRTGDFIQGEVIAELTLKCLNQKAIAVFAIDTTAPTLTSATLDEDKKIVTLTFSESIENALADIATLKTKVTLATDCTTFSALAAGDKVDITNGKVVVTFTSALSTATNKIKIAADSLKDVAGNKLAEVVTGAIDAS